MPQTPNTATPSAATDMARPPERRAASLVRERLEEAVELLAPFLEPQTQWRNQLLDHLALRLLRGRWTL